MSDSPQSLEPSKKAEATLAAKLLACRVSCHFSKILRWHHLRLGIFASLREIDSATFLIFRKGVKRLRRKAVFLGNCLRDIRRARRVVFARITGMHETATSRLRRRHRHRRFCRNCGELLRAIQVTCHRCDQWVLTWPHKAVFVIVAVFALLGLLKSLDLI